MATIAVRCSTTTQSNVGVQMLMASSGWEILRRVAAATATWEIACQQWILVQAAQRLRWLQAITTPVRGWITTP
ncbi:MAG: hypothetical protein N2Z22_12240 [Turneriella sp.]|nr:hypothetical protein [Turneriella sp.]